MFLTWKELFTFFKTAIQIASQNSMIFRLMCYINFEIVRFQIAKMVKKHFYLQPNIVLLIIDKLKNLHLGIKKL